MQPSMCTGYISQLSIALYMSQASRCNYLVRSCRNFCFCYRNSAEFDHVHLTSWFLKVSLLSQSCRSNDVSYQNKASLNLAYRCGRTQAPSDGYTWSQLSRISNRWPHCKSKYFSASFRLQRSYFHQELGTASFANSKVRVHGCVMAYRVENGNDFKMSTT